MVYDHCVKITSLTYRPFSSWLLFFYCSSTGGGDLAPQRFCRAQLSHSLGNLSNVFECNWRFLCPSTYIMYIIHNNTIYLMQSTCTSCFSTESPCVLLFGSVMSSVFIVLAIFPVCPVQLMTMIDDNDLCRSFMTSNLENCCTILHHCPSTELTHLCLQVSWLTQNNHLLTFWSNAAPIDYPDENTFYKDYLNYFLIQAPEIGRCHW